MPRIGVCLGNFLPTEVVQEGARIAEERGYEICWTTETSTGYGKDAPSQLAAAALATSTIKLGTAIIPIYTRTPTLIAQAATSLDEISNGRFILGLGTGHGPNLGQNHGITLGRPFQRVRECVAILREALGKGKVTFQGEIYTIPNLVLLVPNPQRHIPIYLGALGPRMAQLAGELADGVILNMVTREYLEEVIPQLREAARQAGRDPAQVDIACLILACADDTHGEEICRRRIANYLSMPFYQNHMKHAGFAPEVEKITRALQQRGVKGSQGQGVEDRGLQEAAKEVSSRMLDALALAGNPEGWAQKIERYRAAGVALPCPYIIPAGPNVRDSILKGINALKG